MKEIWGFVWFNENWQALKHVPDYGASINSDRQTMRRNYQLIIDSPTLLLGEHPDPIGGFHYLLFLQKGGDIDGTSPAGHRGTATEGCTSPATTQHADSRA